MLKGFLNVIFMAEWVQCDYIGIKNWGIEVFSIFIFLFFLKKVWYTPFKAKVNVQTDVGQKLLK